MSYEHAGPNHDRDCMRLVTKTALCWCPRSDWLNETVTRAEARRELLTQLGKWSLEQMTFVRSDMDKHAKVDKDAGRVSEYSAHGIKAAGRIAEDIFLRMRLTALTLREECEAAEKSHAEAVRKAAEEETKRRAAEERAS